MEKFLLIKKTTSYISKPDKTNTPITALVSPSQNVLINDQEKVEIREGYSLYGAAGLGSDPIESSADWQTSTNSVINLRAYDEYLQFYDSISKAWVNLSDGFSAVDFSFDTWWDTLEGIDLLLFVNGSDCIWDWSGGTAKLSSATSNTITKTGTATWANSRFLTAGTREVIINGTTYAYTGGESTTTLTGVSPTPATEAAGSTVFQAIRLNDDEPVNNAVNDFIRVLNNQLWIGSNNNNEIYVSKNTDFKDFAFSSPRVPGEGALLALDSVGRAFARQRDVMGISAGRNDWYKSEFAQLDVGGTLSETLKIKKLKTGIGHAAQSQDLTTEVGDYIVFINFNKELMMLGDIENLEEPHLQVLSDPIKPDFDDEDFTNGHIKAHKNRIYIACPAESRVWINETRQKLDGSMERLWQPPQILPIRRLAVISDLIYGHSSGFNETYKLFDGTNDNDISFKATAAYAYRNYRDRGAMKVFDEFLIEGYIAGNTELNMKLNYDFDGATQQLEEVIDGNDDDILFEPTAGGTLGDDELGGSSLGDQEEESSQLPKFRVIKEFPAQDFFEIQVIFETDKLDAQWEILAHGGNVRYSKNQAISIKK